MIQEKADSANRIRGVLSPVVTPFKADLSPDQERLLAHCRWLLSNDVGLAVFGTNSEANSMSVDERVDLLDYLVSNGIAPHRMMPGTGCSALPDTVRLTSHAVKLGAAGALMLPPFYYKGVSDDGLFRSFSEVIERVGDARLRVYLYNIPPVSQVTDHRCADRAVAQGLPDYHRGREGFLWRLGNHQVVHRQFRGEWLRCISGGRDFSSARTPKRWSGMHQRDSERASWSDRTTSGRVE